MKQEMEIAPGISMAEKTALKRQISTTMTTSLIALSDVSINFIQILESFASSFFSTKEIPAVSNKSFKLVIATNEYLGKLDGMKEMLEIQLSNKGLQNILERQLDSGVDWNKRLGDMKDVILEFLFYYDTNLKDIPFAVFDSSMEYGNKHSQKRL
uniref:AlNc14C133G7012 protein n=1 Tax=Albugo laibachii Nc14 TaxID=890382 RepID=F0WKG0_9STRA|nr:AlNc14C133G7012 [Albugo laibachii Nc14]|eukprot:CCA21764.1 AlNc14C133G7012 [Albugo laibachii Nc14]